MRRVSALHLRMLRSVPVKFQHERYYFGQADRATAWHYDCAGRRGQGCIECADWRVRWHG